MVDLSVNLGGLAMRTPVTTASGTFGYGSEYVGALDYTKLGAVTAKGVRMDPWPGNAMPRHCEVFGGLVNAIGLQGPGVEAFVARYVPHYVDTVGAAVQKQLKGSSAHIYYLALVVPMGDHIISRKILRDHITRIRKLSRAMLTLFSVFNIFHSIPLVE